MPLLPTVIVLFPLPQSVIAWLEVPDPLQGSQLIGTAANVMLIVAGAMMMA